MIKAAVISMLAAGPASAGLSDCASERGHNKANAHRDLGAGIVSYEQSFLNLPAAGEAQHVVENCSKSERVITVMNDFTTNDPDRSQNIRSAFDKMVLSDAAFSLRDVQRRLATVGRASELSRVSFESCACAVAYPELRGSKEKFNPERGE